jgi:hypothetical protein
MQVVLYVRVEGCVKHVGAVIVLSTVAVVGPAFVHPFGNPRVQPAKGFDTLLQREYASGGEDCAGEQVRGLPLE